MQQLKLLIYDISFFLIRYHLESHVARHEIEAMKEILLAGDTNRLVAELTFVAWSRLLCQFSLCFGDIWVWVNTY